MKKLKNINIGDGSAEPLPLALDNKRIIKNTGFLYIRMFLIMAVTLYMSRVLLDKLGVTDYGLYNVVGGVVAMLSFLNGTLSIGTSRFITYELGSGNKEKLWQTFNTSFYTHLCLSLIVLVIMETAGLWFFYNKLVIPENRLNACFWVYQLSLLTTFVSISQVPYTSLVQSHEDFNTYAYVSVFEALGKLGICYLVTITNWDRLVLYAVLVALFQILIAFYYRFYCNRHYEESHLSLSFDKCIFKGLMSFSGWNIVANLTETLRLQGVVIIINMFLTPMVVAAQSLANQVSQALMGFVTNFRTAFNPQIIKLYAAGNYDASKRLTLQATVVCYDLILVLALPCIYTMKTIMRLWLVEVPDYAVVFTQYVLISNVLGTFSASFYIPMMAANKIKTNSVAALFLGVLQFIGLYFILRFGGDAMWVPYVNLLLVIGFSMFVKPYVLWKDIDYSLKELATCYWSCAKVTILSLALTIPFVYFLGDSIWEALIIICVTILAVGVSSFLFLEKEMRTKLVSMVKNKIQHS